MQWYKSYYGGTPELYYVASYMITTLIASTGRCYPCVTDTKEL